mgnify:CR=1 FL=1
MSFAAVIFIYIDYLLLLCVAAIGVRLLSACASADWKKLMDPERVGNALISSEERSDLDDDVLMHKSSSVTMHDLEHYFLTIHVDK